MRKKILKGFTLIEVLAVIVVLAIIALIVTPIINNVIVTAKIGAAEDSMYGYVDSIEYVNTFSQLRGSTEMISGTYDVSELEDKLSFKGDGPSKGRVTIGENQIVGNAIVCINGYEITYDGTLAKYSGNNCDGIPETFSGTNLDCFEYYEDREILSYDIDEEACKTYMMGDDGWYDDEEELGDYCIGGLDSYDCSLAMEIEEGYVTLDELEEVNIINNVQYGESNGIVITGYTCGGYINFPGIEGRITFEEPGDETINKGSDMNPIIPSEIEGIPVKYIGAMAFAPDPENKVILDSIIIPESVIEIKEAAFAWNELTSVLLPTNLIRIEPATFYSNNLTNIIIPESLTYIGNYAFFSNNLINLEIPENVVTIDDRAFSRNEITNLVIPNNVKSLGELCFSNNSIETLSLGTGISILPEGVFSNNNLSGTIIIPNSITSIGSEAFSSNNVEHFIYEDCNIPINLFEEDSFENNGISGTTTMTLEIDQSCPNYLEASLEACFTISSEGVITDYSCGVNGNSSNLDLEIPSVIKGITVVGIGDNAFNSEGLTSLILPDSLITIGNGAFSGNSITGDLVIPELITTLGNYAFYNNSIDSVSFLTSSLDAIGDFAFANNELTDLVIPSNLTTIGIYSFMNNNLESVNLNQWVHDIGYGAFRANNIITSLHFPSSIDTIGAYAFADCNITHLWLDDVLGLDTIEQSAFENNQIAYLTIPDVVTRIEAKAFYNNKIISCSADKLTYIGDYAFANNEMGSLGDFPELIQIGDHSFENNNIYNFYNVTNTLKYIGAYAFANNEFTYPIRLAQSITLIDSFAFYNCNIEEVTFGNYVKWIKNNAFQNNNINDVVFPTSLVEIGDYAFDNNLIDQGGARFAKCDYSEVSVGASSFTNNGVAGDSTITLEASSTCDATTRSCFGYEVNRDNNMLINITDYRCGTTFGLTYYDVVVPEVMNGYKPYKIDSYSFKYEGLTSIVLPDTLEIIETSVFADNELTSVTFGDNLRVIGDNAFDNNSITEINLPDKLTYIGDHAFKNNKIQNITFPSSLIRIGTGAFMSNQFVNIQVPSGVELYSNVFEDNNITDITFESGITTIPSRTFYNNSITNLVMPEGITNIGKAAFCMNDIVSLSLPSTITSIGEVAFSWNNIEQGSAVSLNCNLSSIEQDNSFTYNGENGNVTITLVTDSSCS